jgi:hypothetical protein
MSIALSIRTFFHELFGSQVSQILEQHILALRQDYEVRLQDKNDVIQDLREQNAVLRSKIAQYELVLIPLANPTSAEKTTFSAFNEPSSWQQMQADWYRSQEEPEEIPNAEEQPR